MSNVLIKLYGTFITAIAFTSLIIYFHLYLNVPIDKTILFTSWWIAFAGYIYFRFRKIKLLRFASIISACMICVLLFIDEFMLSYTNSVVLFLSGIFFVLYAHYFRKNIILKPLVISASWILLAYLFTEKFQVLFYIQQFIFVFLLTIPFDIAGFENDKIKTFPRAWGIKKSIHLLRIFSIIYFILSLGLDISALMSSLIVFVLLNILFYFPKGFKGIITYLFYDGIIILQTLLYWILKNFMLLS